MRNITLASFVTALAFSAVPAFANDMMAGHDSSVGITMDGRGLSRVFVDEPGVVRRYGVNHQYGHVHAEQGERYSITVRNNGHRRLMACVAVDGYDVIKGVKTPSRLHDRRFWSGCYVISPYRAINIDGWRDSGKTVRRFVFTSERASLANWKWNDISAVGTIAVAVFPERHQPSEYAPRGATRGLGTGAGEQVESHVRKVEFYAEDQASNVYVMHYASKAELVKAGLWKSNCSKSGDFGRFGPKDCDDYIKF